MSNKSFANGVQWAWDATSISLAMTCPRKYYYTMIRQIQPRGLSVHLRFGQLYASALEHFYKYRADGASIDDALLRVVRETMIATWIDGAPEQFAHSSKTRNSLLRSIVWYVDQFGEESPDGIQTYHLSDGRPAVELSFTLEISPDLVFCGHLDRVVSYAGQLYVMDQKTTASTIGPYFFDQFKPDVQMSMYTFAGQAILQSPIRGVLIDGAQIAVGFTRFERGFTYRTKDELEEWLSDVLHIIEQTREYTRAEQFPRNLTACQNYGGCPFKPLCSTSFSHRESVIASDYIPKLWDPIERR